MPFHEDIALKWLPTCSRSGLYTYLVKLILVVIQWAKGEPGGMAKGEEEEQDHRDHPDGLPPLHASRR